MLISKDGEDVFHNYVLDIVVVLKTLATSNAHSFVGQTSGQNIRVGRRDMTGASTVSVFTARAKDSGMTPMPFTGPRGWGRPGILEDSVTALGHVQHLCLLPLSSMSYSSMTKVKD